MSAPVTLYSPDGKRTREIAAIDASGWIQAGWSVTPVSAQPIVDSITETDIPAPVTQATTKAKKNDISRDSVSEG
ncbi:MAG: hypothetical protein V7L02_23305 [Nostoc sp.]|uniref:hypothetical protein n=1 Tax=Nostoc sp. TaxID=1180 RepID=UPI002FF4575C